MSKDVERPNCGIVMPISAIDDCNEAHWDEVLQILTDAAEGAGFQPNLVSNADDVGIIQKRIIQNLYENPIVVCDVSGKNPNVMFELGMRLAFDKPTIIVKDDKTSYSFDTAPIEHIEYPRDLRFSKIVEFKGKLKEKLTGTHQKAKQDKNFTTFLKHFGEFKVVNLETKEVSGQEFIMDELKSIQASIRQLEARGYHRYPDPRQFRESRPDGIDLCLLGVDLRGVRDLMEEVRSLYNLKGLTLDGTEDHYHLIANLPKESAQERSDIERSIKKMVMAKRKHVVATSKHPNTDQS